MYIFQDPDRNIQLTVLTDRCQGGSSIRDGEIELLVRKQCLQNSLRVGRETVVLYVFTSLLNTLFL